MRKLLTLLVLVVLPVSGDDQHWGFGSDQVEKIHLRTALAPGEYSVVECSAGTAGYLRVKAKSHSGWRGSKKFTFCTATADAEVRRVALLRIESHKHEICFWRGDGYCDKSGCYDLELLDDCV